MRIPLPQIPHLEEGGFEANADSFAMLLGWHQAIRFGYRLIRLKNESPFWPPWLLAAIVLRVIPIHSVGAQMDTTDALFIARSDSAS